MKTLYLMRHAKSDWGAAGLPDHARALNDRGRRDAPFMGQQLLTRDLPPLDLILCSPAVRALTTATLVARELNYDVSKIRIEDTLYESDREAYLRVISSVKSSVEELMLVGHNYTITDVANYLSPVHVPELPTAGVVCLRFNVMSWGNLEKDSAEYAFIDFPKNYDL